MKNKTFKRVFSLLMSLLFIFNMNTLSYAAGNIIISEGLEPSFRFDVSNTGVAKNSEVKVKAYFTLSPSDAGKTANVASLAERIGFDDENLEYVGFAKPAGTFAASKCTAFSDFVDIEWNNGSNDIQIKADQEYELGTITFKLRENKNIGDKISFTVIGDGSNTFFSDLAENEWAQSENSAPFDYFLACNHPESSYSEWTETKPATCTELGKEERICSCGHKEERDIAKKGHTYGEWTETKPATCTTKGEKQRLNSDK